MDYYHIFDTPTNSMLLLLEQLQNRQDWLTINELADHTSLERKTIQKYMKNWQALLKDSHDPKLQELLIFSKGKGYFFSGDGNSFQKCVQLVVKSSYIYALMERLFFEPEISLKKFTTKQFISEYTLLRKVRKLNHVFSKLSISIVLSKGFLSLQGPEPQIRYLGYIFFWKLYRGLGWPFPFVNEQKIRGYINEYMLPFLPLNETTILELAYVLALNLTRFHLSKVVNRSDLPIYTKQLNKSVLFDFEKSIAVLKNHFYLSEDECHYFALILQTKPQFYTISDFLKRSLASHKKMNTDIYQYYKKYTAFDQSNSTTNLTSEFSKKLYFGTILIGFLTEDLFKNFGTTAKGFDYLSYIGKTYPNFIPAIKQRLNQLDSKFHLARNRVLLLRLCEAYALLNQPTDFEPLISIRSEMDLSTVAEEIYIKNLTSLLSPYLHVQFVHRFEDQLPVDMIIGNSVVQSNVFSKKDTPRIYIPNDIHKIDLLQLVKTIKKLAK